MNRLLEFLSNRLFFVVAISWMSAQILKTITYLITEKKFNWERLTGSGGMPSAHSASVTSLAFSTGLIYGFYSFNFAVCMLLAIIVIYDARGVRREAGKHAALLNQLMEVLSSDVTDKITFEKKMNELIGHNGLQIFMGILLGLAVSVICYMTHFIGVL